LSVLTIALGVSFALSLVIAVWIVRGDDPIILKILQVVVAFIPFLGPFMILWMATWPEPDPLRTLVGYNRSAFLDFILSGRKISSKYPDDGRERSQGEQHPVDARTERRRLSGPRLSGTLFWVGGALVGLVLANFWVLAILFFSARWPFGYPNFWGESVGSVLLFAILLVATPAYIIALIRLSPKRRPPPNGRSEQR
jgi:hypothetical protein